MNGSLAALFFLASLTDMGFNYCGHQGCFAPDDERGRFSIAGGDVIFQRESIDSEVYLRYDFGRKYGPFQPTVGASLTGDGDAWVGLGAVWTQNLDSFYVQLSFMPGFYAQGDGPDLGHALEFRSGAEIGYQSPKGWRIGLSYDHRSNGDIESLNPGLETLQLRVSIPLN